MIVQINKKDNSVLINEVNELLTIFGNPKEIASTIDNMIFDIIRLCEVDGVIGDSDTHKIYVLRELRDLFLNLENIIVPV